ncbi:MAG: DUF2188 domain-containing protein [Prevotellaceae bacterium]|nr:DUF2188 domain-containing protein [Prevotellaceae bacterium]
MSFAIKATETYCLHFSKTNLRKEVYLMGKNQHVVPVDGRWGIRGEGNSRLTSTFDTQAAAIARAREISRNQQSELFVHGRDGRIRGRDSHGNDPFPPRG